MKFELKYDDERLRPFADLYYHCISKEIEDRVTKNALSKIPSNMNSNIRYADKTIEIYVISDDKDEITASFQAKDEYGGQYGHFVYYYNKRSMNFYKTDLIDSENNKLVGSSLHEAKLFTELN